MSTNSSLLSTCSDSLPVNQNIIKVLPPHLPNTQQTLTQTDLLIFVGQICYPKIASVTQYDLAAQVNECDDFSNETN